jgi:hypothetical protein
MTDDDGEAHRRRKGRKRLPVDILGQNRPEDRLTRLMQLRRHRDASAPKPG